MFLAIYDIRELNCPNFLIYDILEFNCRGSYTILCSLIVVGDIRYDRVNLCVMTILSWWQ